MTAPHHRADPEGRRRANRRSLLWALPLLGGFMVAETAAGVLVGSLALLAHAGHMRTDSASIGVALVAVQVPGGKASAGRTAGLQRVEVLAALAAVVSEHHPVDDLHAHAAPSRSG